MPPVTVGVPVYNGASLIRESLENLATQTYKNFRVVISDNASTDGTSDICAEFAARDSRFRHVRADVTSDAMTNFFRVRDMAESNYFMWRAFDDLSSPNFIEGLMALHEANPGLALAVPAVRRERGARKAEQLIPYRPRDDAGRLRRIVAQVRYSDAAWFYGLWNHASCVRITDYAYRLYPDALAGDHVMVFHAILNDALRGSNDVTFFHRLLPETRDYIPRPKPNYSLMVNRNKRFYSSCLTILRKTDLTLFEKQVVSVLLPWYAYKRTHKLKRLIKTRIEEWSGRS